MNDDNILVRRRRLLDAGPHQPLLAAFGRHLAGTGLSPVSVHIHLGSARHFLAWLVQSGIALDRVGPDIVARFAAHDCRCHSAPRPLDQYYINRVDRFVQNLADRGVVPPRPVVERPAVESIVADWLNAQTRQRGLAPVTIEHHGRMLAQILPFIGVDPSRYTPRIIRDGLLEHARTARSVHYPKMVASALRLYVHLQGPLAPAKGAEVGHGPIHASQLKQALDEPGRLPQWQPEQDLHLQAGLMAASLQTG